MTYEENLAQLKQLAEDPAWTPIELYKKYTMLMFRARWRDQQEKTGHKHEDPIIDILDYIWHHMLSDEDNKIVDAWCAAPELQGLLERNGGMKVEPLEYVNPNIKSITVPI